MYAYDLIQEYSSLAFLALGQEYEQFALTAPSRLDIQLQGVQGRPICRLFQLLQDRSD